MYRIEVKPAFERSFDKLTRRDVDLARRLRDAIEGLAADPRPPGARKLTGVHEDDEDLYRLRIGAYRILYAIRDRVLTILLVAVDGRKDVYK